jgi:hypothetical protein
MRTRMKRWKRSKQKGNLVVGGWRTRKRGETKKQERGKNGEELRRKSER